MTASRIVISALGGTVLFVAGYFSWAGYLNGISLNQLHVASAITTPDRAEGAAARLDSVPVPQFGVAAQGRIESVSGQFDLGIGVIGTLAVVYVDEGDTIRKGQLLAELVNQDEQARVAEAASSVNLRKAELEKLVNGARPEERRRAEALVEKSQANASLAQQELARRRPLAASGISSQQALEQAVSSLQVAEADNRANRAALELVNAPPRAEDLAMAQANLALAEATFKERQALLEKTQLRSPIDGIVLRRYLKTGETISIQPLIPVLQVAEMDHLRIRAEVDETDVAQVKVGQRAWAMASAYPGRQFEGVVAKVGQRMGRKQVYNEEPTDKKDTNVLDVLIDLNGPGDHLPSGLRVNVFFDRVTLAQN